MALPREHDIPKATLPENASFEWECGSHLAALLASPEYSTVGSKLVLIKVVQDSCSAALDRSLQSNVQIVDLVLPDGVVSLVECLTAGCTCVGEHVKVCIIILDWS